MLLLQVLASVDGTAFLEPVTPGKLIVPAALAGAYGKVTVGAAADHEIEKAKIDQEVKESMQSHFD